MSYTDYLARRALGIVPTLFGLSVLIFTISRVLPGDPVKAALGKGASEEAVQRVREQMGLDNPLHQQYVDWLLGVFQGDWGMSLRTNENVLTDILARLPATLELVIVAMLFAVLLAVPFGVIAGTNKDDWPDYLSRLTALLGVSMPRWWLAIVLQILFVAWLGLFPLTGRLSDGVAPPPGITHMYLVDSLLAGQFGTFLDAAHHLVLPAFALGFASTAQIMRLIRSDMIDELQSDYAMAAHAHGIPRPLVVYKYLLKNAFSSSLTIIGLGFAAMLGNAFLVEIVFSWPGLARYGARAVLAQDFNAIIGITMVIGTGFALMNFVVDVLYGYFDPRIRLSEGGS